MDKMAGLVTKPKNSERIVNLLLVLSFATLSARSLDQQREIQALEAEKELLVKSTKEMKQTLWDWKQKLYSEAESDKSLVPLARIKAIYGEAPLATTTGEAADGAKPSSSKLVI